MTGWLWFLAGMLVGIWIDYNDASYYKNIVKLQERYITLLLEKLDAEK